MQKLHPIVHMASLSAFVWELEGFDAEDAISWPQSFCVQAAICEIMYACLCLYIYIVYIYILIYLYGGICDIDMSLLYRYRLCMVDFNAHLSWQFDVLFDFDRWVGNGCVLAPLAV